MAEGITTVASGPAPTDRRARRRQETIEEILAIAEDVMNEEGVNGLSLSEVARRLGVKPPSIYKYFDSLMAIYDVLFERGQQANLDVMRDAMDGIEPGLDALAAGLEASCRWCLSHPAIAQLMFWRPVPSFEPTSKAMDPSADMVRLQRQALADASAAGQLGPGADSDEALFLVSIFVSGLLGQAMANEPGVPWGEGRFRPLFPKLLGTLAALYPPQATRRS
ncbi:MAG TPA: TetR/AcrR family transcriptional regulator [Acidimicrobiales bacterium]|nr:TetR/AcrR family transcriptional regulator [Acidimicrobiales bacterium]